jgi:radical SAM/SPASM domain FxsB family protein
MEHVEPLNEFIVKIASRCNLNCDYCYEFNLGDESWRGQPKFMSDAVLLTLGSRIREHATIHRLEQVFISLHGGEPLMVGPKRLDQICETLSACLKGVVRPLFTTQTNGTLLNDSIIEVVAKHDIAVSVSIDGVQHFHDRHRRDHNGKKSYERVVAGVNRLKQLSPRHLTGILSVIDVESDPLETLEAIAKFEVEHVDFLLPHHNLELPPPRPDGDPVAYGKWYFRVYEAWVSDRYPSLSIRFLENIVSQLAGGRNTFEAMTLNPCTLITIATDGGLEGVDCLKSTASGIQRMGLNIQTSSFEDAIQHQLISVRQSGELQLSETCKRCDLKKVCGGGYFPHRWSTARQFDNPSIYCEDLAWLIRHIATDLHSRLKENRHSTLQSGIC